MSNKPILAPSPVQQEVARQASNFYRAVEEYRNCLPDKWATPSWQACSFRRSDGWHVTTDWLDGDYDLDEGVARSLIEALVNSDSATGDVPAGADAGWLRDYLQGKTSGAIHTNERFNSETKNALIGPGSLPNNVNTVLRAVHANVEKRSVRTLEAAIERMRKGGPQQIKLNPHMTLYNANKSRKGRPRPRLRISSMPIKIAQPTLSMMDLRHLSNGYGSAKLSNENALEAVAKSAADLHWSGKLSLRAAGTGGILTFAPSAILDAMSSIEMDLDGHRRFDTRGFVIASARSQSGNLAGWGVGEIVMLGVAGLGVAGAPVILAGLIAGFLVTIAWNTYGGADWAGAAAEQALGK